MKLFFVFILSILSFGSFALTVTISGGIKGFENRNISANKYSDYITFSKVQLAETKISNGKFTLNFNIENTQQIILRIEDKETSLFAEPGKNYNIALSYDAKANQGNAFDKYLNINFLFPNPSEANSLIKLFNSDYQDFFEANYQMMILKKANTETEVFIKKQSEIKAYQNNTFVNSYVNYALANLEDLIRRPEAELFSKYLKEKPILHNNKEFMNFFIQFYKSDFEKLTLSKKGQEILKTITFDKSLIKTISAVKEAKKIQSNELAELYLCYGLFEVFHSRRVNQNASLNLLEQIAIKSKYPQIRILANNIKSKLQLFGKNQDAPGFKLNNIEGKEFQLSDFKGKVVYLNFWASWSIPSLRELQVIKALHEKYQSKVHFISINVDEGTKALQKVQSQKSYPWTMLHYGDDYKVRERFDVRTVPTYFLIDENGKILTPFAPGPRDIEKKFYELK
jgi:thiol-disulfide isomerase/thioredoxin